MFYGRIVSQTDDGFDKLLAAMASFYSQEGPGPGEVVARGLYALKEDQACYRSVLVSGTTWSGLVCTGSR